MIKANRILKIVVIIFTVYIFLLFLHQFQDKRKITGCMMQMRKSAFLILRGQIICAGKGVPEESIMVSLYRYRPPVFFFSILCNSIFPDFCNIKYNLHGNKRYLWLSCIHFCFLVYIPTMLFIIQCSICVSFGNRTFLPTFFAMYRWNIIFIFGIAICRTIHMTTILTSKNITFDQFLFLPYYPFQNIFCNPSWRPIW